MNKIEEKYLYEEKLNDDHNEITETVYDVANYFKYKDAECCETCKFYKKSQCKNKTIVMYYNSKYDENVDGLGTDIFMICKLYQKYNQRG